jgi:glycosyltransferase involved in cell wall biosynthesis
VKVVFLQPIIPHYRKHVVKELLATSEFTSFFITSKKYLTNSSVSFDNQSVLDNHNYKSFKILSHTFYWLIGSGKRLKKINPNVIVFTGYDPHMIHVQWLFFKYAFFSNTKVLWWSHGSIGKQGSFGKIIRAFFYKNADGILAYSKRSKDNLIKMGVKEERIKVVNNSIPIEDYAFLNLPVLDKRNAQKNNAKIKLIFVGKLTLVKRIDLLVEAVAGLKEKNIQVHCDIVGTGQEGDKLKRMIHDLKLQNEVTMHGAKYGKDLHQLFFNADIYVLPGSVGLSILHAYAFGLPMITSNEMEQHSPEVELLTDKKNGLFYDQFSVPDLVGKIISMHESLRLNRFEIAKNCIDSIIEHEYLPEAMVNNIVGYLKKYKA